MKEMRRLAVSTFCDWLRDRLPAAGKPCVHDLRARALRIVDAMPPSPAGPPPSLDVSGVRAALEWVFQTLLKTWAPSGRPEADDDAAESESWAPLALHVLRLVAVAAAADVHAAITRPARPADESAGVPAAGNDGG